MTRLRDAFDALADRGEPLGADVLFARAREAVARGAVAELQPATKPRSTRFRVVVVVGVCVAVIGAGAIAMSSRNGRAPTTGSASGVLSCRLSVGSRTATVVLDVDSDSHKSTSVAGYRFDFAVVLPTAGNRGSLRGIVSGPGLGARGSSAEGWFPSRPGLALAARITSPSVAFTCTRSGATVTQQTEAGLQAAATAYANAFLTGTYLDVFAVLDPHCVATGGTIPRSLIAAWNTELQTFRSVFKRETGIDEALVVIRGVAVRDYTGSTGQAEVQYTLPESVAGNDNWNAFAFTDRYWHLDGCDLKAPIGGQASAASGSTP